MRKRTQSREWALKILYQSEITRSPISAVIEDFLDREKAKDQDVIDFTKRIALGVEENLKSLDKSIVQYAANWDLKRMAVIDRNILRMGVFELKMMPDIPEFLQLNIAHESQMEIQRYKEYSQVKHSKHLMFESN